MKKVLFAVHALTGGGAERAVSVWASKLADVGYDVTLLTYSRSENEYSISNNVKRVTVADTRSEYLALGYFKRLKGIRNIIKATAPDVVISFLTNAQIWVMLASIGLNVKRIETVRISPWHHTDENKLYELLWRACYRTGDLIILQSADQKPFFDKRLQKKCVVISNTVDEKYEKFGKSEISNKLSKFVAAGRITEQKNYPMMIEAFANAHKENPNINLEIYGAGNTEYIDEIQKLIHAKSAGDYIKLCGRTNDMHSIMLNKDAFIMSSDFEGMPNALIEAMTVGLVCVSTDCKTGPRDLIKDGENGFLVPVGDVEMLAEKILRVASLSASEIKDVSEAARRDAIELCGEKNTVQKLIDAIESV